MADWLHAFREVTMQMSCTGKPMLSTTHAVFRGLQEELQKAIAALPKNVNPQIQLGLLNAHRKLSDYYHSFDQSPFYTWAASKLLFCSLVCRLSNKLLVLDPRIMYSSLKDDYKDDLTLSLYLDNAKDLLSTHFHQFYANRAQSSKQSQSTDDSPAGSTSTSRSKFDFTACYSKKEKQTFNELEEYLKLHPEDFDSCCPFKWWLGRRAQFPNLYRLATDILSIPGEYISFVFHGLLAHWVKFLGSAVGVECVFSRGRDKISLRRASLHSDTICILMISKCCLRMARDVLHVKKV